MYGEGRARAFRRLEEEIIKKSGDHSIIAWSLPEGTVCSGMLADGPELYSACGDITSRPTRADNTTYAMSIAYKNIF